MRYVRRRSDHQLDTRSNDEFQSFSASEVVIRPPERCGLPPQVVTKFLFQASGCRCYWGKPVRLFCLNTFSHPEPAPEETGSTAPFS